MSIFQIILLVAVALILVGLFAYLIHIVPQAKACIIKRLGAYHTTWDTGVHILVPFMGRVSNKATLEEVVKNFTPQPVIIKDNVTIQIDTIVYFQITDPKLYTYDVVGPTTATENLTATTLRNIIDDLELDETLTSRNIISTKMRAILDEAADPWGVRVNCVEVKSIIPSHDIQEAVGEQTRAEREQCESILRTEGERRDNILTAENKKGAMVPRASAKKGAMIAEVEGQVCAMERIYRAQACDIKMIKNANPTEEYLSLKSLETYEKMADGKATEIVVPNEMQNMASFLTSAREILVGDAAKDAPGEVIKPEKG